MATNNPIVPIPLPVNGVLADQSLRLIGGLGLADSYNWIYRNGRFTNRDGYTRKSTAGTGFGGGQPSAYERPMGIVTYGADIETQSIVVGTNKGWWVFDTDGTLTDITDRDDELSGTLKTEQVVFRVLDTGDPDLGGGGSAPYLIGVNGVDTAKYWDGDTDSDYIQIENNSQQTMVAKSVIALFDRIIYLNVKWGEGADEYPDGLVFTEYLEFDNWLATSIVRLADTPGYIVGGMEFGNQAAAIYKSDAIYMCSAIGQPNAPFRFDLKLANIAGPVSPLSIVAINNGLHAFLGKDGDVVLFDGSTTRSLGPHIHAHFQKYMDFERQDQAFGFYDYSRKELFFFYPAYNSDDMYNAVMINLTNPNLPTLWPMQYNMPFCCGKVVVINESRTIGRLPGSIGGLEGAIGDFGSYTPVAMIGSAIPETLDSGTATAGGAATLTDTTKSWTTNEFVGDYIEIISGTGDEQTREIKANTGDTITTLTAWDTQPSTDSGYIIYQNEAHLYTMTGVDDDGEPIDLYLRTGFYDLGETTRWKTLQEIDHLFNMSDGQEIDCQLVVSLSGENADLTDPQTISLDQAPFTTYHRETGRLFGLVYSGSCTDEIEWLGSEASFKLRGRR